MEENQKEVNVIDLDEKNDPPSPFSLLDDNSMGNYSYKAFQEKLGVFILIKVRRRSFYKRDHLFRPDVAKGNRTRPVSNNTGIYFPCAAFSTNAEDQSEVSNMKKMQDRYVFE
ncbi:hypothetical protein ACJMK2_010679 [Sinanodonta woodiana]|uniref:Uncharacterized protein n=1 Tax=Sinanodonta woodiana TaxID=1069815 RepID=A0ABD3VG91_SINWO